MNYLTIGSSSSGDTIVISPPRNITESRRESATKVNDTICELSGCDTVAAAVVNMVSMVGGTTYRAEERGISIS